LTEANETSVQGEKALVNEDNTGIAAKRASRVNKATSRTTGLACWSTSYTVFTLVWRKGSDYRCSQVWVFEKLFPKETFEKASALYVSPSVFKLFQNPIMHQYAKLK
jgi:hypothetical protein